MHEFLNDMITPHLKSAAVYAVYYRRLPNRTAAAFKVEQKTQF